MLEIRFLEVSQLNDDSLFNNCYQTMSTHRQNKIDFFRFRKDKNLSLGAGLILDSKLKTYGLSEKEMEYGTGEFGKPFFINKPDLHFSISHSGTYVIVAFSDYPVGCDIEENKQFGESFMKLWTQKESYLKATGQGLSKDPREVSLRDNDFAFKVYDFIPEYTVALCYNKSIPDDEITIISQLKI